MKARQDSHKEKATQQLFKEKWRLFDSELAEGDLVILVESKSTILNTSFKRVTLLNRNSLKADIA